MPENDPNLEENVGVSDLSSISVDDMGTDDILDSWDVEEATVSGEESSSNLLSNSLNENMFLESWYEEKPVTRTVKEWDNIWSYLRWFFFSWLLTLIWIAALTLIYSFDTYITQASQTKVDSKYQEYVEKYKDKLWKVKDFIWINNKSNYSSPTMWLDDDYDKWSEQAAQQAVNEIINASDIDYIEKKDLLSSYAEGLVNKVKDDSTKAETLRQDIAKQWFLPKELEILLSENETIDTIQRSLNALEIIK